VYGNIFEEIELNHADVLVHGCNCFCNMGAGIALDIKNKFPEAFEADLKTELGARHKLGTYSHATVTINDHSVVLVNAYTQFDWRGQGRLCDYKAIIKVFRSIKKDFKGLRIIYPLIGAGLARGNWETIKTIIDNELHGEKHYCVQLIKN
jgi:O-acetyl-ADP-ribose deacetylase (regulator of RNase III)